MHSGAKIALEKRVVSLARPCSRAIPGFGPVIHWPGLCITSVPYWAKAGANGTP